MISLFSRFFRDNSAAAFIEMALALPFLLTLFYGTIEMSRYIIILQKADKASYTVADLITRMPAATSNPAQAGELDQVEVDTVLAIMPDLMDPYSNPEDVIVCVSSIQQIGAASPSNPPIVRWQVVGGGTLSGQTSNVNNLLLSNISPSVRNTATNFAGDIADSFAVAGDMRQNENIIVVEIYYSYQTIFDQTFGPVFDEIFKRNAFFSSRQNEVYNTLPPNFI